MQIHHLATDIYGTYGRHIRTPMFVQAICKHLTKFLEIYGTLHHASNHVTSHDSPRHIMIPTSHHTSRYWITGFNCRSGRTRIYSTRSIDVWDIFDRYMIDTFKTEQKRPCTDVGQIGFPGKTHR